MATPVSRSPGRVVLPNYAHVGIKAAASGDGPGAGIRGPSPLAGARSGRVARPPFACRGVTAEHE